jgi:hypothetical protein
MNEPSEAEARDRLSAMAHTPKLPYVDITGSHQPCASG